MEKEPENEVGTDHEIIRLRQELEEANLLLDAIRTGQVDALVVDSNQGPQLYTLTSADQSYRFFIEQMREGAITLDREGLILFSNRQFADLVDLPVSAVIGRNLMEFVLPEEVFRYREMQKKFWTETGKAEFCLVRTDRFVPVNFLMTPLELGADRSLSVLVTDLTEQKKTENALKESNEKLSAINRELESSNHDLQQFASVASHDLQEPIRKIQIFSSMLRDEERQLSSEGVIRLNKVISSADRMKMLIVDILNYSALSAKDNHYSLVSLNEMMESLKEDFELLIHSTNALIRIDPLPEIRANAGQLRQVFQNLLSNALKFTRAGIRPEIVITCTRVGMADLAATFDEKGKYWLITVADNGIGFEKQYAGNIFSLFERLNGKDKFEGTGIGLAIAKKIVEKHGGLIGAQSAPGQGSVFSFILPIDPEKKAAGAN